MRWIKGDPFALLQGRIAPGDTVIDVGAAWGAVSEALAQAVGPTGAVYALEPDPRWAYDLGLMTQKYPQIRHLAMAGGAFHQERTFYQAVTQARNSFWVPNLPAGDKGVPILVRTLSLDEWFKGQRIAAVKIDTQGAEVDILQGATDLLQTCPTWVIECWPEGLKAAGATAAQLYRQLVDAGLTVSLADGSVLEAERGQQLDALLHERFINLRATR